MLQMATLSGGTAPRADMGYSVGQTGTATSRKASASGQDTALIVGSRRSKSRASWWQCDDDQPAASISAATWPRRCSAPTVQQPEMMACARNER